MKEKDISSIIKEIVVESKPGATLLLRRVVLTDSFGVKLRGAELPTSSSSQAADNNTGQPNKREPI